MPSKMKWEYNLQYGEIWKCAMIPATNEDRESKKQVLNRYWIILLTLVYVWVVFTRVLVHIERYLYSLPRWSTSVLLVRSVSNNSSTGELRQQDSQLKQLMNNLTFNIILRSSVAVQPGYLTAYINTFCGFSDT